MHRTVLRLNQFIGIVVGLVGALMTANFWPEIRMAVGGWVGTILWGIALGGLFGSMDSIHMVGYLITRRENHALNTLLGLLAPFSLIGALLMLLKLAR